VGSACHRDTPHNIDRVEIASADEWEELVPLGLDAQDAVRDLKQQLAQDTRFHLLSPRERAKLGDASVRLALGATVAEIFDGSVLEIRLIARSQGEGEPVRLDAVSDVKLPEDALSHPDKMRPLLARALADARDQTAAQLSALKTPTPALRKQLAQGNSETREAALRVLTLRRDPAAVPVWMGRLEGPDPLAIRQAIGALVELKDPRATPALIDLARRQETGFLREIIFALEAIGGDEAEGYLYTLAQGHDEPRVREAAQAAGKALEERRHKELK
jgi:HEAT repeat protein